MKRLARILVILVVGLSPIACGGESGPKISEKLKGILDRAKIEEQNFREVPSGMKGLILYITPEDLKAISQAETMELLTAASHKTDLTDKTPRGIRIRLMTKKTEGWIFGEVIRTKDVVKNDLALFDHNKTEALKELGM